MIGAARVMAAVHAPRTDGPVKNIRVTSEAPGISRFSGVVFGSKRVNNQLRGQQHWWGEAPERPRAIIRV
jgi:hypothetical protein